MIRKYFFSGALLIAFVFQSSAQMQEMEDPATVAKIYDQLTADWVVLSNELKSYSTLQRFCGDLEYRKSAFDLLARIHHYDSLVMQALLDPTQTTSISHKEFKHTMKDIRKFEEEYSLRDFVHHLKTSCDTRNDLERNKADLMKESGMYSYDGQVMMVETELAKYLKHIDKRILSIDDHLHLLTLEQMDDHKPFQ